MIRKKEVFCIFAVSILLILLISSVSAISRENFRIFLKAELNNYFSGKSTLLSTDELRTAVDFYFSTTDDELDLSKSGLSQSSINIINMNNQGLTEEFSCTLVATAKESYGAKKEGYKLTCCEKILPPPAILAICIVGPFYCKEGHSKVTECLDIQNSAEVGHSICSSTFGDDWSIAKEMVGCGKFTERISPRLIESCTVHYTNDLTKTKIITTSLSSGQEKQIPIDLNLNPKNGGSMSRINYVISCRDPRISANIVGNSINIKRN